MDLDRDGWRSVTNDAAGVVADFAELRLDLLAQIPLILHRDNMGQLDGLYVGLQGTFAGSMPIGAKSEAEAVTWVLARHG